MNKYIKLIFALFFVAGLASCLKDKDYDNNITGHNLSNANKIIELGYINETAHEKSIALDFINEAVTPTLFYVRLAASEVAQEDITVTLDTTGYRARVIANGQVPLPDSIFSVASFKVVIPKGARQSAPFSITTNASKFDPSTTYGVYFRIASVSPSGYTISGNFGEFINTLSAKNKYDGRYVVSGIHNRAPYNAFPFTGIPMNLVTSGGNTVDVYNVNRGEYSLPIGTSATTVSSYGGAIAPRITFDPVTNNVVGVSNLGTVAVFLGPNPGKWDPATKTLTFQMFYTTGANQDYNNRGWNLTFTYVGPR